MSKEGELLARHRAVMPAWLSLYYEQPIEIVRGEGRRVFDGEGREYLDFFGGILTNMVGYAIPEISGAIERQLRTGVLHTSTMYLIRNKVELAEQIAGVRALVVADDQICLGAMKSSLKGRGRRACRRQLCP